MFYNILLKHDSVTNLNYLAIQCRFVNKPLRNQLKRQQGFHASTHFRHEIMILSIVILQ